MEVKAMFGLDELKQTKVFQEAYQLAKQEAKLEIYQETIARLLQLGLSVTTIAQSLNLPLEVVQQAQKMQESPEN